jgi:hypothetical protein
MLILKHLLLLNHFFDLLLLAFEQLNQGLSSRWHLELEQYLKAEKHRFNLDELFNSIHVFEDHFEVQESLPIILCLVSHGGNIVQEDPVNFLGLVRAWDFHAGLAVYILQFLEKVERIFRPIFKKIGESLVMMNSQLFVIS